MMIDVKVAHDAKRLADGGYVVGAELGAFTGARDTHVNLFVRYARGLAAYGELATPGQLTLECTTDGAHELVIALGGNWELGVWNPAYRIVAFALPDSVLSLNLLYLLTQLGLFVVAFLLGRELLDEPVPSMAFGLAIVGCGFVVGHASHFSYLQSLLGFLAVALGLAKGWRSQPLRGAIWCGAGTLHIFTAGYPQIALFGIQLEAVAIASGR